MTRGDGDTPTVVYHSLATALTNGKRVVLVLPYPMSAKDYDLLERYIALQVEAFEDDEASVAAGAAESEGE